MDTRDRIIEVALKLFALRGFSSVGIQEIVNEAGITKPTLYHHFGSKAGLIQGVLDQTTGAFIREFQVRATYHHDLTHNLNQLTLETLEFAQESPLAFRLVLSMTYHPEDHETADIVQAFNHRLLAPLQTLFELAAEDHGNMKGRHQLYALSFWGTLLAQGKFWILDQKGPGAPDLAYRLVHQFMHGIFS